MNKSVIILVITVMTAILIENSHAWKPVTNRAQCRAGVLITETQCNQMMPACAAFGIGMRWMGTNPCGPKTGGCRCVGTCDYLNKCGAEACNKIPHCTWVSRTKKCLSLDNMKGAPVGAKGRCPFRLEVSSTTAPSLPPSTGAPTQVGETHAPTKEPTNQPTTLAPTTKAPTTKTPTTKAPTKNPTFRLATYLYKSNITVDGSVGLADMLDHCVSILPEQCEKIDGFSSCVTPWVSTVGGVLDGLLSGLLGSLTSSPLKNILNGLNLDTDASCSIKNNLPILSAVNLEVIRKAGATGVNLDVNLNEAGLFDTAGEQFWLGGKYLLSGLLDQVGLGLSCQAGLLGSPFTSNALLSLGIAVNAGSQTLSTGGGGLASVSCATELPFLCACQRVESA